MRYQPLDWARLWMRGICVSVALAWAGVSVFAGSFHHHADDSEHTHSDCVVCQVAMQPAGECQAAIVALPLPEVVDETLPPVACKPVACFMGGCDAVRAPPFPNHDV